MIINFTVVKWIEQKRTESFNSISNVSFTLRSYSIARLDGSEGKIIAMRAKGFSEKVTTLVPMKFSSKVHKRTTNDERNNAD